MLDNLPEQDKETLYYDRLHAEKYRDKNQSREQHADKMASNMASTEYHAQSLFEMFKDQRFLPAGRVQAAMGANDREVSAFNCSVSNTIEDDIDSIMDAAKNAAKILRLGTGIGYNFSRLRPKGALIEKLQTEASGPVSFMRVFEAVASTIASSGHRRGAQMAILNVDHPDIEAFINAKMEKGAFRHFNLSVGITDAFMEAVEDDAEWKLIHNGKTYNTVSAVYLWDKIMQNAYHSAEPGVIFLDKINHDNNLWYCEHIDALNPCAEQPLPPNGLCLLGSFNLTKYVDETTKGAPKFNSDLFVEDIHDVVEAYDNIFDKSIYAIPEHELEAKSKRRMGLGLTGIANAIEYLTGAHYGTEKFNKKFEHIAELLRNTAYRASVNLAKVRGAFGKFDRDKYLQSNFIKTLPKSLQGEIYIHGIRNSHLISYAPCGTISQVAGNVSSGIEPVFFHHVSRDVHMAHGLEKISLKDHNYKNYGYKGKSLEDCTVQDHITVAAIAQKYCDSAVSKTVNVATSCPYSEYQQIYKDAYHSGSKGITVFRPTELRGAVITAAPKTEVKKVFIYGESGSCVDGVCSV